MRWLYSALMWLVQPLYRRRLKARGRHESGYLHAVPERFGHYTTPRLAPAGPTVWLHAVSLGETRAAVVLVDALRARVPGLRLVLTHGTATGRAEGVKLLRAGDLQVWQPWDTVGAVNRFLDHFSPDLGVLMETEIWPNLVHACRARGLPLVLANARLSEKSLRQAQRLAWLARPAYAGLTAVWAQTPADAQRLQDLGAPVRGVMGNLKFDAVPDAGQLAQGRTWRAALQRPVLMLASSRPGEEQALLALIGAAAGADLDVHWLIVPRHPQRFDEVAALIEAQGFAVQRRSRWPDTGPAETVGSGPTVWLGDSLGEMALYFALADVALLGGSFEPLGGQNLIEAAACGCPVVMGPHTFNFADAAEQALAAHVAFRVENLTQAMAQCHTLLGDAAALASMRDRAGRFASAHQGAAVRLADALLPLLAGAKRPLRE